MTVLPPTRILRFHWEGKRGCNEIVFDKTDPRTRNWKSSERLRKCSERPGKSTGRLRNNFTPLTRKASWQVHEIGNVYRTISLVQVILKSLPCLPHARYAFSLKLYSENFRFILSTHNTTNAPTVVTWPRHLDKACDLAKPFSENRPKARTRGGCIRRAWRHLNLWFSCLCLSSVTQRGFVLWRFHHLKQLMPVYRWEHFLYRFFVRMF